MSNLLLPTSVRQNIARARSLFRRDEALRGIESLITGLELYDPSTLLGKARFEAGVLIQECILDLNQQRRVKDLLASLAKSPNFSISYVPGEENKLKELLEIIKKALHNIDMELQQEADQACADRRRSLEEKALDYLAKGEGPLGKATLRNLAEEFGSEPGVLTHIGELLVKAGYKYEAMEFFENAMEAFPKDHKAYQGATTCAMELSEAEKAVKFYTKALREFGKHPITLLNLAKAYAMARNREKAFEFALAAAQADPSNEEAKAMAKKYS